MPAKQSRPLPPANASRQLLHGVPAHSAGFPGGQGDHRDLLRRHNLAPHAVGAAQGLTVTVSAGWVQVTPGLALDCMRHEICVPAAAEISLAGALGWIAHVFIRYAEQAIGLISVPGIPVPCPLSPPNSCLIWALHVSRSAAQPPPPRPRSRARRG